MPFPSPGDLPDPEIDPGSPALQADALPSEPPGKSPDMKKKKKKGSPRHATFKRLILHNREMQTIGKCIPGKVFEQWSDNAQCEN